MNLKRKKQFGVFKQNSTKKENQNSSICAKKLNKKKKEEHTLSEENLGKGIEFRSHLPTLKK